MVDATTTPAAAGRPPRALASALPAGEPRIGDRLTVCADVLAEVARAIPRAPATWRFLAAGTRGKLIGWREHEREEARAVIDVAGEPRRLVVFVRARHLAGAARPPRVA